MPRKKSRTGKDARAHSVRSDPAPPGSSPEEASVRSEGAPFPIVAIGASAGGLDACNNLLATLPADTGMAFVIVQHLSPSHESLLTEILQRATRIPVQQVQDGVVLEPDHLYVIPPGKDLVLADGHLALEPRAGQRPIDRFMRSIAEQHEHKSIAVVLSGTGNDGSLGVREIKAAGGITFAQDTSAEQDSMPRSAIATGAIDFVLPPQEIGREIGRIARHPYIGPSTDAAQLALSEVTLGRILALIRQATQVDFSAYKSNTLKRRITRRMLLQKYETLQDYLAHLQRDPQEVEALYNDVLINVTSFFRNPAAYEALKAEVFPQITGDRARREPVRIWTLGCSTGEEAYSLAIAFLEYMEASGSTSLMPQIFASDLNEGVIEKARAGIYPKAIAEDVGPERLRRFFTEVDGSYRIAKSVREMCVFARQNVLADPPFSRIDLVSCRNVLIYLDPSLQRRVIPMLHYALRDPGFLWLGHAETVGPFRELFDVVDAKNRIYRRKPGAAREHPILLAAQRWETPRGSTPALAPTPARRIAPSYDPQREADRVLVTRYAPPSVVVNDDGDILQFRGDTSAFLMPAPGRATLSLLKMLREGLLVGVRGALTRAKRDGAPVRENGMRVRREGTWREVSVEVSPIRAPGAEATYLIVFEDTKAHLAARTRQLNVEAETRASRRPHVTEEDAAEVRRLKQELSATRDYLQSVIEQQEASNEELQSANEEVQSANEELQSINEELETTKEEIQAANEELATVNSELQSRNHELAQSNNDFANLLASVQLPIVMAGSDLRVRRFTPAAERVLRMQPSDIGRPLGEVRLAGLAPDLARVAAEVLESMTTYEREVQDTEGHWHLLRVRPYRTQDNQLDGVVMVMIDIDRIKRGEQELRESEGRFEALADSAPVLIWIADEEGLRFVNRAFEQYVGVTEADLRDAPLARFVHPDERAEFAATWEQALRQRGAFEAKARLRRSDGQYRWMKTIGTPRIAAGGEFAGFVGGFFDVTDLAETEAALRELDRGKDEFLATLAHELRNPLAGVRNASRLLADASNGAVLARAQEIIGRQTGNMVRMVDDLLDLSRITHGKVRLQPEPLDLAALVRHTVEASAHDREAKQQALELSLPGEPLWVNADPVRADQIVANLLDNASKFTRRGGRIWVTLEREDGSAASAVLRVRDNGVGIDPDLMPRIFDLFMQGASDSERSRGGMGLGLTLARDLVQLHGGTIEAFSAGNALGSEFVVRLPALVARSERREPRRDPTAARYRLLIVDDDADSAESMRMMFSMSGHEVSVVHEGGGVVAAAAAFHPDAILLDIGLPDMDGYAVARALRADPRTHETMIVAVTGFGRAEDVERARVAGADEHLTKPIDPDALIGIVGRGRKTATSA